MWSIKHRFALLSNIRSDIQRLKLTYCYDTDKPKLLHNFYSWYPLRYVESQEYQSWTLKTRKGIPAVHRSVWNNPSKGDAIFALFEFWVIGQCSVFSVWYAHAYHAVICAMICAYHAVICTMICVAEHDMRIRKWHVFLNISQVLLNISLLKSFLLMIYVFKWHNLTILDM